MGEVSYMADWLWKRQNADAAEADPADEESLKRWEPFAAQIATEYKARLPQLEAAWGGLVRAYLRVGVRPLDTAPIGKAPMLRLPTVAVRAPLDESGGTYEATMVAYGVRDPRHDESARALEQLERTGTTSALRWDQWRAVAAGTRELGMELCPDEELPVTGWRCVTYQATYPVAPGEREIAQAIAAEGFGTTAELYRDDAQLALDTIHTMATILRSAHELAA